MQTRDVARTAVMVALAVALSPFFIPVGVAKGYPAQHMITVMAAESSLLLQGEFGG
jgi:energy coupling factor transporter S component ThiW